MRILLISIIVVLGISAPLPAQTLSDSASVAWNRGDTDRALRLYGEIFDQDPRNTLALHRLALLNAWEGDLKQSLQLFDRLLEMAPEDQEARVNRARVLMWSGRSDEALRAVRDVLDGQPANEGALALREALTAAPDSASLAWSRGETQRAYRLYRDRLQQSPSDVLALHRVALIEAWEGNHDRSLELFDRLVRLAPDDEEARLNRARVLMWSGRNADARMAVDEILQEHPDAESALALREELTTQPDSAALAWSQGDTERAHRLYTARLERDSEDLAALHRVALIEGWRGNFERSLELFDRLLTLTPNDQEVVLNRAQVLARSGRADEALTIVEDVLTDDPMNLRALEIKAQAATLASRLDESVVAYDRLMELDTARTEGIRLSRARVLGWAGDHARAVEAYQDLLEADPDNLDAIIGLARVQGWSGEHERAASLYRRALVLDPGNLQARQGLAQVMSWQGELGESETMWRDVLATHPGDVTALVGLATTLRWQGRNWEAKRVLDRAEQLDPENQAVGDARRWVSAALSARLRPGYTYESDSDGNRVSTLSLGGSGEAFGPVEVSFQAVRRILKDENNPLLDRESTGGLVSVGVQAFAGWRFSVGAGTWSASEGGNDFLTATARVSSPGWQDPRITLAYNRSVFDFTALVVETGVVMDEFSLALGTDLGDRVTLSGGGATASIEGTESNTRLAGNARLDFRPVGWFSVGAAARAFSYDKDLNDGYWDPELYANFEVPIGLRRTDGTFLPSLEISPGYQKIEGLGSDGASFRALAGLAVNLGPFRQVGISGVFASSGLNQLSPTGDSDYEYRAVNVFATWSF